MGKEQAEIVRKCETCEYCLSYGEWCRKCRGFDMWVKREGDDE